MTDPTYHHLFDTALGICGVAWGARGLVGVQLPERDNAATERRLAAKCGSTAGTPPPWVEALILDIRRYLAGAEIDFSAVTVDLDGIDQFRRGLYDALRRVGFGNTVTYGELAKIIGLIGWEGARDVGEAMGRNPMPIVIPCHRVLAAGNKLGGFSAHGGTATKQKLLTLEGMHFGDKSPRLPGF